MSFTAILRLFFAIIFLVIASSNASASDRPLAFRELHHTAWGPKDGLFGVGTSLAQTTDGFLWIGTFDGLYRFDGNTFERYQPFQGELPNASVSALLATADGSLWIGYRESRISRIKNGVITNFGPQDGIPVGGVRFLIPDANGGIFSSTTGSIIRYSDGHFTKVRENWSLPLRAADCAYLDNSGTFWITSEGNTFYLLPEEHAFRDTGLHTSRVISFIEDRERIGLVSENKRDKLYWVPRPRTAPMTRPYSSFSQYTLTDSDGAFWIGNEPGGLHRGRDSNLLQNAFDSGFKSGVETLNTEDGMSSGIVGALLEDREGDVWAVTVRGIDRFRVPNAVVADLPQGYYSTSVTVGPDGEIWIAPWDSADGKYTWTRLYDQRQLPERFGRMALPVKAKDGSVYFMTRDRDLTTGETSAGGLWHWTKSGVKQVPKPPTLETFRITSMALDDKQHLWVQVSGGGEWLYDMATGWTSHPMPVIRADHPHFNVFHENPHRIYALYSTALLSIENQHMITLLKETPEHLRLTSLGGYLDHILLGTNRGLFALQNGLPIPVTVATSEPIAPVSKIISSEKSGLWVVTTRDLIHVDRRDLAQYFTDPSHNKIHPEIFDLHSDLPEPLNGNSGASLEDNDGIFWFSSLSHIVKIDQRRIRRNQLPPSVLITHITVGGKEIRPNSSFSAPPRSGAIAFNYTATSLPVPERVRFRFQLEGNQGQWFDAARDRKALFYDLPPGKYRFHVIASNNDGIWNEQGASLGFNVLPRFYQTLWFRLLIGTLVLALVYLLVRLRLRAIAAQLQNRMAARDSERQHIARELHDDFFPGVNGLLLSVNNVARNLPSDSPARPRLESILDEAETVMDHGRDLVLQLRSNPGRGSEMVDELVEFGRKQESLHSIPFDWNVAGVRLPLSPQQHHEIVAIFREALWNSFRHSDATRISLKIEFSPERLQIDLIDDGCGIEPSIVKSGRVGHLGLISIRERAREIGASLVIDSKRHDGTTIRLTLDLPPLPSYGLLG